MKKQSLVFDIKRYAINDGPGVRITVFFKGCPLHCAWCHNPESQSHSVQKMYTSSRCIGCSSCVEICPEGALNLDKVQGIITDWNLCNFCGLCAKACPSKAVEMIGNIMTTGEIMKIVTRETMLIDASEGGVTFSGGEPLQHHEILIELLKSCGQEGIHRAVDTCGYADSEVLFKVAHHTDLFLYDLKHMNPEIHKKYTGVSNALILHNLHLLAEHHYTINTRIPLIEGFNTDSVTIEAMARFISSLPGKPARVNLLPYHSIASKKYEKLGQKYYPGTMKEPTAEKITECLHIFENHGLQASVGG